MQIDSFMKMSKEKRPPEDMWDDPDALDDWFDRVYDRDKDTEFNFTIDEVEG